MSKNSFVEQFNKSPFSIFSDKFQTLKRIKILHDKYISQNKPLITRDLEEEQIWVQIEQNISAAFQQFKTQSNKLQDQAERLAELETQRLEQEEGRDKPNTMDEEYEQAEEEDVQSEENVVTENYEDDQEYIEEKKEVKTKKTKDQIRKDVRQTQQAEFAELLEFEKYMEDIEKGKIEIDEEEDGFDQGVSDRSEDEENADNDNNEKEDHDEIEDEEVQQDVNDEDGNVDEGENSVFEEMREVELGLQDGEDQELIDLEGKLMQRKEWQMIGEVSGKQRPLNSLLDENLDFKASMGKATIEEMTQKHYSATLEDKIKKRCQDELWDDRVRTQFSQFLQENFGSKKTSLDVDTNKAQFGLAEIYEQQFKSSLGLPSNTTELKVKQEIFALFRDLSYKLDSLSNLSYEPRGYVKPAEIKTTKNNNETAIGREEKVPFTFTGSKATNPEKIKKQQFISKDEATPDDNQRGRRQVKRQLRNKLKKQKRKSVIKKIETKGETKFMYNQAEKGRKKLSELNSQIKQQKSVTFDKSSKFFKNLQTYTNQSATGQDGVKINKKIKKTV